jgi:hypothetical protein
MVYEPSRDFHIFLPEPSLALNIRKLVIFSLGSETVPFGRSMVMVIFTLTGQEPSLFLFSRSTITTGDVMVKEFPFKIPESSIALSTSASEGWENLEQPAPFNVRANNTKNMAKPIALRLI